MLVKERMLFRVLEPDMMLLNTYRRVLTGQSASRRWVQRSVAVALLTLVLVGHLGCCAEPATAETCLRAELASAFGKVEDARLLSAIKLTTGQGSGFTIDSTNSASPESIALSDSHTWNAMARCHALVPNTAPLPPPRYAVRVSVVDESNDHQVPVQGAYVYAKPAGLYCTTDGEGACTLTFVDAAPQDRVELHAMSSSRINGPVFAGTLEGLVKRGAVLKTAHSYPTLMVSITDCKTHQPLRGRGSVLASPIQGQIWDGVESIPPARQGEGRLAQFQDEATGRVAFLYDDRTPLDVVFVVHLPGRPTQQIPAGRITANWVQLEYTEDCASAPPPVVNQIPACTARTIARIRQLAHVPSMTGQHLTVQVGAYGLLQVLDAPPIARQRLTSLYLSEQPPCLATLTL